MKFIELTLTGIAKKKVFLNPSTIGSFVCQGDFTGIGLTHGATMSVQETPEQVMQLINGNQKESGWVKHTGDTIPFSENKFVLIELESGVITFGDAISFNWKRNDKINNIEYYKIIERRTK